MKFQSESQVIKSVMQRMAAVCESRTTIPIIQNILIQAGPDSVTFKATDLDIMITERVNMSVSEQGSTTAHAFTLKDIVGKLDDGPLVTFHLKDTVLHIQSGKSKFKLNTLPADDFPVLANEQFSAALPFGGSDLKRAIDRTIWAASTDESRYYLKGIALQSEGERANFITTDGHRLAKFTTECEEHFPSVIIPTKTAKQLSSILIDADVTLHVSETKIKLVCGGIELLSKVIDGVFPAWERVVPASTNQTITAASTDLAKAVERVQVVMNERSKIVKLAISEGELTLNAPPREGSGEATDTIEAVKSGPDAEIGVSAKYALDAMKQADKGNVTIQYGGAGDPLRVTYDREPELLVVVMPARF